MHPGRLGEEPPREPPLRASGWLPSTVLDPLETARLYYKAYPDRDCDALMDILSEASWSEGGNRTFERARERCRQMHGRVTIDSAFEPMRIMSENAERAIVEVRITHTTGGSPTMYNLSLVRQDGAWKVDDLPVF